MQLTTLVLSMLATAASAAPAGNNSGKSCAAPPRKFGIMALRSASPIHFATLGASQSKLVLNLPDNKLDAVCTDGKARKDAILYIKDEQLFLYGKDKIQQIYVDRSGMGQGVLQYVNVGPNPGQPGGRFEIKGWAVDANDNLTFNGVGLLACPNSADNSWTVWVDAGITKPAGQEGCLGFNPRTLTTVDPVQCTYSNYSA